MTRLRPCGLSIKAQGSGLKAQGPRPKDQGLLRCGALLLTRGVGKGERPVVVIPSHRIRPHLPRCGNHIGGEGTLLQMEVDEGGQADGASERVINSCRQQTGLSGCDSRLVNPRGTFPRTAVL